METSDSECFESADEDFFSGDEIERNDGNISETITHDITEVEKLEKLNIKEEHKKSNIVGKSGKDKQSDKQFVKDDTICVEKISSCKETYVEELKDNIHVEKLDVKSRLDTENKNIPEDDSITCKSNYYNKGTSIDSLNDSIDVSIQEHEEKHVLDSNKNKNREDFEGSKDNNTSNTEECKPIDHTKMQVQQTKVERIQYITNNDIKNPDTSKVDTHMIKEMESNANMWENDGWDIDNDDIKDGEVSYAQNRSSTSNQTVHKNSTYISKMEEKDIQRSAKHLESKQITSDIQRPNIQLEHLGEEKKESENMWDNDDWEPLEEISDQSEPQKTESKSPTSDAWSSWGSWGVSSILTTATQGVSTLTNHVSQGLNTIVNTSLGIPDPQELARQHKREEEELKAKIRENVQEPTISNTGTLGFGLGNLGNLVSGVSNLTKFVETTSNKVISGGLDTLETIGKKTMEVLQEGDPGLKKKRQFLKLEQEKPILSQVLREAKEKAEQENQSYQQKHIIKKKNYETLFDDHHGLVHLEALEMLSKQCDIKLKTLTETCGDEKSLMDLQETLEQVKELCELPDEDEEEQSTMEEIKEKVQSAVQELNINISYDKLLSTWEETEIWLNNVNLNICDGNELHQQAIEMLAQLTAIAVEQFHKAGELLLIKEHRSTADEADSLVQLTTTLTSLIGIVAGKFSDKLNVKASEKSNKEDINGLITNVFFEAANSSSYIQDAFQLLIPVLQVGAV